MRSSKTSRLAEKASGGMLSLKQTSRPRQIAILAVLLLALYCMLKDPDAAFGSPGLARPPITTGARRPSAADLENRSMFDQRCRVVFPGLHKEIDEAVARGPFTLKDGTGLGPTIVRVRNGKLSILRYARKTDLSRDMLAHRGATLHQIANAILTSPAPVNDTIFAFNHQDSPSTNTLSYSRPADPSLNGAGAHYFPIPHFSQYSWPVSFIESLPAAASRITALEAEHPTLASKDPRAVWRGTVWFNNVRTGPLRPDLVAVAAGQPWADVEPLAYTDGGAGASNAIRIEDFCRYRYIVYTEGVSYSGRFQFHQLCASVVLSPPIAWMQHLTHLVRPAFSYALDGVERRGHGHAHASSSSSESSSSESSAAVAGERTYRSKYPTIWAQDAWPRAYAPEEANMVFVAPDWSDLESTIEWLERHPEVAEGIARRQRDLFHGGGYFSPAAENCYWRALLQGWSEVVSTAGQGFEDIEGTPWEEFSLTEMHH